ncbi:unnamed protein product [Rotaria sp. Silwood2]|nr:unnamed protein product [Rotaria sp. Silwood2]CAF4410939.1 unnamed protein product [Rotaria sp. Silwood2]
MAENNAFHRFIQMSWEDEKFLPIERLETNNAPLTITQAVQRTKVHMPDLDVCIEDVMKRLPDDKQYKLTLDERVALRLCTEKVAEESLCVRLDRTLRSEDKKARNPWQPFLQLFYSATKKLPDYQGRCWRAGTAEIVKQIQKGKCITWSGISSCSIQFELIEKECLDKNGILFMIDTICAKDISKYSTDPYALEIILMPGTRLVVKNIEPYKKDSTITLVYLQEQVVAEKEATRSIQVKPESPYEQTPFG